MSSITFGNKCGRYLTLVACFIYLIFGNVAFAVMTDNEFEEQLEIYNLIKSQDIQLDMLHEFVAF